MHTWTCIENCGACCKFDIDERSDITDKLSAEDMDLINTMISNDGWCKYLDRTTRKCNIYEKRPHFCRVNKFSKGFREYKKFGDEFLIDCCKQHISSNYGTKSKQMKDFKKAIS